MTAIALKAIIVCEYCFLIDRLAMKVKCNIKKIEIENFRGIKNLDFEFHASQPTVVIGPNNVGKTTFLDALGLVLASGKFLRFELTDDDFWKDDTGNHADEFTIKLTLEATDHCILPAVKGGVGDPIDVHAILVRGNREDCTLQRVLLDSTGTDIMLSNGTPVSKANKDKYQGTGLGGSKRYARLNEIQKHLPEIWHLDPKNLYESLYIWKTGPLQQLLGKYKDALMTEEWTIDNGHKMPKALQAAYNFLNEKALKTPFWTQTIAPKINLKFKSYLGSSSNVSIQPSLNSIDNWILSQLLISVSPDSKSAAVDLKRLGDGWQSLMRLIALEVLSETDGASRKILLLVEEPETYLHPHLRRKLRTVFSQLQEKGNQVCIATHSSEMICYAEPTTIVRFTRNNGATEKHIFSTAGIDQTVKDNERLTEGGNHEIVFANKVILTEGKDDQYAIMLAMRAKETELDTEGVSVVNCHSVTAMPAYAEICTRLGIPWYAIHDKDFDGTGKQKPVTEKAVKKLNTLVSTTDKISTWDNDLEDVLGFRTLVGTTGKAIPEWTDSVYGKADWSTLQADSNLSHFIPIIESADAWIKQ